ncbi:MULTISPECIES: hypothetical protein [unclassified Shinella]|uniref:hypothetical protein n=1 Tax=Shinella TaxID=323620 RepID=UPI00225DB1F0|nr:MULTISPECIES: hypothetical protein [unclassified Shinella]CAI0340723.1 conserved exported hypothetical protein [Rhizobiaceae bacterium]CAK7259073.1 DUF4148 domain-containing protein [Shinella sp. WSC3-e]MCO5137024.1 hypothetical protein [Shinella sp.]MCW5706785.1 hypothetical protein [Shinella sp.]MDC7253298.1 hypothetical protein [Shinella sp. YE25]
MSKSLNAAFAATLLAASLFGGSAAFAGGDYYRGVSPTSEQDQMIEAKRQARIANGHVYSRAETTPRRIGPANGDYYPGLDRTATADR